MANQFKRWAFLIVLLIVFMMLATSVQAKGISTTDNTVAQGVAIDWQILGRWFITWFVNLLIYFIFGLLALWLFPKPFYGWSERVRTSPWKSFALGVLGIIVGFTSLILLFAIILALVVFFFSVDLGGLAWTTFWLGMPAVGLTAGIFYFTVAYLSKLVVAFMLGLFIFRAQDKPGFVRSLLPLLLGLVIFLLIRAIPFLGWAAGVVVTLLGLGAILSGWNKPKQAVLEAVQESPAEPPFAASDSEAVMLEAEGIAEEQGSEPVMNEETSFSSEAQENYKETEG